MQHIVLLHGALASNRQFTQLEEMLQVHFHVDSLTFSGHGRTPSKHHSFTIQNFAHEVLDWMNDHQLPSVDLFGYSMGGYVALWLARFYPDRVRKIYTLGTKMKWNEEEAKREIKKLNPEIIEIKVPKFAQELARIHGEHEWKSVVSRTAFMMNDLAHLHLDQQDFEKIEIPVCLTRGDQDDMVSAEETEAVSNWLKNATVKNHQGVRHALETMPVKQLTKEIEAFFLEAN